MLLEPQAHPDVADFASSHLSTLVLNVFVSGALFTAVSLFCFSGQSSIQAVGSLAPAPLLP